MELQFQNKPLDCLRSVHWSVKSQEQTQEVKLPEAMPDVGKVLCAWGQCVLRSKEWHGGSMGASGGIMTWVLYAPEDGTFPRVVEVWIPYQFQWELPPTQRDGAMIIRPQLRSVDARVMSARKLMVRACVDAVGEALEPVRIDTYSPDQLPDNTFLLRRKYPVCIPMEAGEKTFTLEEDLQLPPECADAGKLIHYGFQPEIKEQKCLGDKLLVRGVGLLYGLCRRQNEKLCGFQIEVPFSQYTELENAAADDAQLQVTPAVTNLDLDILEEGKLRLKVSLVTQYLICRKKVIEVVEDAYSPGKTVQLQVQQLQLPAILELQRQMLQAEARQEMEADEILDVCFTTAQPEQYRSDGQVKLRMAGSFQVLCRNGEDNLQAVTAKWEQTQEISTAAGVRFGSSLEPVGLPVGAAVGGAVQLRGDVTLERMAIATEGIPMVTGLEISDIAAEEEEKPSLILRRPGSDTLWEIAKQCGSTEDAIRQANGLTEDPAPNRMLLIPVI